MTGLKAQVLSPGPVFTVAHVTENCLGGPVGVRATRLAGRFYQIVTVPITTNKRTEVKQKRRAMLELTQDQVSTHCNQIEHYIDAANAADGSAIDPNANVDHKTIATMKAEIHKSEDVQINRRLVQEELVAAFGDGLGRRLAKSYVRDIEDHIIYCHDESNLCTVYCAAIDLNPLLSMGTKSLGGHSGPPKHLSSYLGQLVNTLFTVSSQVAGAVGIPGALVHMDAFARHDFGPDYMDTNLDDIKQSLEFLVYTINEPAGARGHQCFDEETELLTKEGFKTWDQLSLDDLVMVSHDNGFELAPMLALNLYDHDGEMHSYGKGLQVVTPNHRVLHREDDKYVLSPSSELIDRESVVLPIVPMDRELEDSADAEPYVAYRSDNEVIQYKGKVWCPTTEAGVVVVRRNGKIFISGNSCFSNISIFDKDYFDALYGTTYYPTMPDIKPDWNSYKKLQEYAIDLIREENTRAVLTFPVKTATILHDGKTERDPEFVDMLADDLSKGSQMFLYLSTSVDSLSSCCFSGDQEVTCRADGRLITAPLREVYENCYKFSTLNTLSYDAGGEETVTFKHCSVLQIPRGDKRMMKVRVTNSESGRVHEILVTEDHLHPVLLDPGRLSVDIQTSDLKVGYRIKSAEYLASHFEVVSVDLDTTYSDEYVYCLEMDDKLSPYFVLPFGMVTHNCRLKNSLVEDDNEFSYSLGAGGVSTGSLNVITLNMNRIVQENKNLKSVVDRVIKYQVAHRRIYERFREHGMYPIYDAGYVDMNKQFLTTGVNGLVEAAESLGIPIRPGGEYEEFVMRVLQTLHDANKAAKKEFGYKFNTEFVPAESLGVRNAKWDKEDGYRVTRDCYNSYFFPVEDPKMSIIDKFKLHGGDVIKLLDGGSALHLNLDEHPSKEGYKALIRLAIRTGCEYFTTNVLRTACEDCQHVEFSKKPVCVKCGSTNVSYATRIIGYLKKIPSFSSERQTEAYLRTYHDSRAMEAVLCNENQTEQE